MHYVHTHTHTHSAHANVMAWPSSWKNTTSETHLVFIFFRNRCNTQTNPQTPLLQNSKRIQSIQKIQTNLFIWIAYGENGLVVLSTDICNGYDVYWFQCAIFLCVKCAKLPLFPLQHRIFRFISLSYRWVGRWFRFCYTYVFLTLSLSTYFHLNCIVSENK